MDRMKTIVKRIVESKDGVKMLREDPKQLAKKLKLSKEEILSLFSGDIQIIHTPKNPLAQAQTITFTTGSTITGSVDSPSISRLADGTTTTFTFDTGSTFSRVPQRLEDLSRDDLLSVTRRALGDKKFAARLREFLDN